MQPNDWEESASFFFFSLSLAFLSLSSSLSSLLVTVLPLAATLVRNGRSKVSKCRPSVSVCSSFCALWQPPSHYARILNTQKTRRRQPNERDADCSSPAHVRPAASASTNNALGNSILVRAGAISCDSALGQLHLIVNCWTRAVHCLIDGQESTSKSVA